MLAGRVLVEESTVSRGVDMSSNTFLGVVSGGVIWSKSFPDDCMCVNFLILCSVLYTEGVLWNL
jgi:hypothetical protein